MQGVRENQITRPYAPQDLLLILLSSNYKQNQCESELQKLNQQKQSFKEMIAYYNVQIQKNKNIINQIQIMIQIRAKLRLQLTRLQEQRRSVDFQFVKNINQIKVLPFQNVEIFAAQAELNQLKDENCKMRVRFDSLVDYCQQLQNRIKQFQQYNKIGYPLKQYNQPSTEFLKDINMKNHRQNRYHIQNIQNYEDMSWRQKVTAVKLENQMYSAELRQKNKYILNNKSHKTSLQKYPSTKQILKQTQNRFNSMFQKQNQFKFYY